MEYYTKKQAVVEIKKSLYKAHAKYMKKYSKLADKIVDDVLDGNEKPEVSSKVIPPSSESVMYKNKKQDGVKSVNKLKNFINKKCK